MCVFFFSAIVFLCGYLTISPIPFHFFFFLLSRPQSSPVQPILLHLLSLLFSVRIENKNTIKYGCAHGICMGCGMSGMAGGQEKYFSLGMIT